MDGEEGYYVADDILRGSVDPFAPQPEPEEWDEPDRNEDDQ